MRRIVFKLLVVYAMIFGLAGISYADITSDLVAYYPLDGDALDYSGNENDGIVSGAILTSDRVCTSNYAYDFDGTDDYITVNSPSSDLNIGHQSWTISGWVQTTNLNRQSIVSRYECGWNCLPTSERAAYYMFSIDDGIPEISIRSDNGNYVLAYGSSVSDGKWHHIVAVLDRTNEETHLYVDGELEDTVDSSLLDDIDDSGSPFTIGYAFRQGWAQPVNYFDGKIDNVRIYNRALTSCDVAELFYKD